jgi:hypothetical protein
MAQLRRSAGLERTNRGKKNLALITSNISLAQARPCSKRASEGEYFLSLPL